eukprot:m.1461000 g.1461000  ORF g.1461000 m.1461000 type:complete len:511 (+) comp25129_c0_seq43:1160-2692(+)
MQWSADCRLYWKTCFQPYLRCRNTAKQPSKIRVQGQVRTYSVQRIQQPISRHSVHFFLYCELVPRSMFLAACVSLHRSENTAGITTAALMSVHDATLFAIRTAVTTLEEAGACSPVEDVTVQQAKHMAMARLGVVVLGCLGHFPCTASVEGAAKLPQRRLAQEMEKLIHRILRVLTTTGLTGSRILWPEPPTHETDGSGGPDDGSNDVGRTPLVARACYAHAVLVVATGSHHHPVTGSAGAAPVERYVRVLLEAAGAWLVTRGVELAAHVAAGMPGCDATGEAPVAQLMLERLVQCPHAAMRQYHVARLHAHLHAGADERVRHALYKALLASCPFANACHLLILWVKTEVMAACRRVEGPTCFVGQPLMELVSIILRLPAGDMVQGTALWDDYDKIMAALNFWRFLLLSGSGKDVAARIERNETGIWTLGFLEELEREYLKPLFKVIPMLREKIAQSDGDACEATGGSHHGPCPHGSGGSPQQKSMKLDMLALQLDLIGELLATGKEELC